MFFTYRHTKEWSFFRWAFRLYNWCDSPPNQCPSLSDPTEDLFWNLLPTSRGFHHQQNSQIRHAWNLMETHPMYVLVVVSIGWLQFFTYRKCLEISKFSSMKKKTGCFGYQLYTSIHLCSTFEVLSRNALNKNHPRNSHAIQETF